MLALWFATPVVTSPPMEARRFAGEAGGPLHRAAGRFRAVLGAHHDRLSTACHFAVSASLVAACGVFPMQAVTPPASPPGRSSVSSSSENGAQDFQWVESGRRLEVHCEGKIDFNPDWSGIAHLASGARMHFVEQRGETTRWLEIRPGILGHPIYTWSVDGRKRAFDAAGHAWLQEALLSFVRGSGYAAEERSVALLEKQGPAALLAEISQVPGDRVKVLYFARLLARRDLGAPVMEAALRQAGRQIGADHLLANLLVSAAEGWTLSEAGAAAYIEALRSIGFDHDRCQAASALVEKERLSPANLSSLLEVTRGIGSDHERASLLVKIAGRNELSGRSRAAYLEATGAIRSRRLRDRAEAALVETPGR